MTDLIKACKNCDINKVKYILKNTTKINLNFQDKEGNTALMLTSISCNTEIIKLLLNYGNYSERIDTDIQDNCECNALI